MFPPSLSLPFPPPPSLSLSFLLHLPSPPLSFSPLPSPPFPLPPSLSPHWQGINQLQEDLSTGPQTNSFRGEVFCQLGHLHLLLEEYREGMWEEEKEDMVASWESWGVRALFSPRVPGSFRRAEEELTLGKRAVTDSACLVLASYLRQYCDANLSK